MMLVALGPMSPGARSALPPSLEAAGCQSLGKLVEKPTGEILGLADSCGGRLGLIQFEANGSLDADFGDGGYVATGLTDRIGANIYLRPDGGVLAVGDGRLEAFRTDGDIDSGFGTNGAVVVGDGNPRGPRDVMAVALLDDGRIVVSGLTPEYGSQPVTIRLLADGKRDPAFGTGGFKVADAVPGWLAVSAIEIGPAGKIYVGGLYRSPDPDAPETGSPAIMRLAADGEIDQGYGVNGFASTAMRRSSGPFDAVDSPFELTVDEDGSATILFTVTGGLKHASSSTQLSRFDPVGEPDGGSVAPGIGYSLAPDGGVIFGGTQAQYGERSPDFMVGRTLPGKYIDPLFGNIPEMGVLAMLVGKGTANTEYAIASRDGDSILASGYATGENGQTFVLAKLDRTGALVPGFGDADGVNAPGISCANGEMVHRSGDFVSRKRCRTVGEGLRLGARFTHAGSRRPTLRVEARARPAGGSFWVPLFEEDGWGPRVNTTPRQTFEVTLPRWLKLRGGAVKNRIYTQVDFGSGGGPNAGLTRSLSLRGRVLSFGLEGTALNQGTSSLRSMVIGLKRGALGPIPKKRRRARQTFTGHLISTGWTRETFSSDSQTTRPSVRRR